METNDSSPSLVDSNSLFSSSAHSKNSTADSPLTAHSHTINTNLCPTATSIPRPNADPFGYMNSSPAPCASYSVGEPPRSLLLSNASIRPFIHNYTLDGLQSHPLVNSSLPPQVEPIYPHAFVTFGAGMRQKEIDTFTAKHKLEARYTSGHGDGIPYHVPL